MKFKKNDLVYINHSMFNRFETFKVIKEDEESIKIQDIHSHQTLNITNKSIIKKVKDDKSW
jgi:hypothetical protein